MTLGYDIMVFRGTEYWPTPEAVIREVKAQGLSVRIPRDNPPRLVKGLSRIVLAHRFAVMTIENGTEDDLREAFASLGDPEVDRLLAAEYEHPPSRWLEMPARHREAIFERLGVRFFAGVFAYCYYTGTTYYLRPEEEKVPGDLAAIGVTGVRAVRAEEEVA